jgi:SpoVK/Ycf46/Vps4 family AAA+-type ATPase
VDRPVVFIPPQMINCLSNPEFTELVTNSLKGSILVIEDAEKALMKRESQDGFFNSELVSSILNLTDGLYADLAQTAIIATYNCDRNLIDPALLRKGRLRSEYHFQKLSVEKSQKLMDKQGHDVIVEDPMTLADIFNYEKQYSNKKTEKKRSVGFGG